MKTEIFTCFKLLLVSIFLGGLGTAEALAQKTTIRVSNFLSPKAAAVAGVMEPWRKRVQKELGDEYALKAFWGGALGRNPRKQADLVKDGVTDIAMLVPGYTPGQFPGYSVFELPFMARTASEAADAEWRVHTKRPFAGFDSFKTLAHFATGANNFHTKRPIKKAGDIKGMKFRIAGPVYGATVKHFGGIPVGMPVTQATEALSRGVVEGVVLGIGGVGAFRMDAIVKHHYMAPLGVTPLAIVMNKKKFHSLPAKVREVIDKYSGKRLVAESGIALNKNTARFRGKMEKAGDHNFVELSEAQLRAGLKDVWPVHQAWIKRTKDGQVIYDLYKQALADIRAGK